MSTAYPLLLSGHDTIECAYYLAALPGCTLDYEKLAVEKEALRLAKVRRPKAIQLGSEEFLLMPNGTKSGYPFLIENDCFSIQFGEFNKPNFFVTYRSFALWQFGEAKLNRRFLDWAASVGFTTFQPESLSRVDFTFDYQIETIDFDEDTRNNKDAEQQRINLLNKLLAKSEQAQRNLLTAIESGLPFDEVTQKRAQELKAERESLLIELAGVRRNLAVPVDRILPSNIEAFSKAIRAKLKDKDFAKRYLQVLVDEIVVDGDTATMRGSYAALANAIAEKKKGTSKEVPSFMSEWRARSDSNARPSGS